MHLVLASQSPRRRELLGLLGIEVEVRPARADERVRPGEAPEQYVRRVAAQKAVAAPGEVVVAADTAVVLGDEVLGKPRDAADAARMLRALAGRSHRVLTAVCVRLGGPPPRAAEATVASEVVFAPLDEGQIAWYVATGEPLDKAGAYALQGTAGVFVQEVRGSVSNVVGLPLHETARLLRGVGFPLPWEVR